MKRIMFITIMLVLVQLVGAEVVIEYGKDNTTWENVTGVDEQEGEAYAGNLDEGTLYYFRARNSTSDWYYFTQRTDTSGEKGMSSIAVTGFALLITVGLLLLPSKVRRFSDNEILDTVLKGCCYVLGLFLLSLDAALVVTLSDTFALGVNDIIFRYMWLINWAAYLSMGIVVLSFGYKALMLWTGKKAKERMGYDEEGQAEMG